MTTEGSRLASGLGTTLRHQRQLRGLRQRDLARRAGVSQAAVARIELGERGSSLPMLERLFAELGLQLRVETEPLDTHLDAALDRCARVPLAERIDELRIVDVTTRLGEIPFLLDGPTAALLQGAPLPCNVVHLLLCASDLDTFAAWLDRNFGRRWDERFQEYGCLHPNPHEPGAYRWATRVGEVAVRLVEELPPWVTVHHDERSFRVVPLPVIEVADRRTAALLQRHRDRLASGR